MRTLALAIALTLAPALPAVADGDPERGERIWKQCGTCHQVGDGAKTIVGPPLTGLLGRNVGTIEGFRYSKALAENAGRVWDDALFLRFVENPKAVFPGTRMSFVGIRNERGRRDLLAWLKENGG